jgi:exodeoxyribonuclease VII large subunit
MAEQSELAAVSRASQALSVTQLVRRVRDSLEKSFSHCWVMGEISNARQASSGHLYFTLKDAQSAINIVMFRNSAQRLRFKLEDGIEVLVFGRVSVYESRGALQFYAEELEPRGAGALQIALEQLKRRLAAQGLFNAERKRALPFFPRVIGLVTALGGPVGGAGSAALHDMLKIIFSRNPNVHVIISPAKVQGDGAGAEIAAALKALNADGRAEVIVLGRGGGSLEDLWAFNEEVVARAIYASRIPVVSAVGHEIDYTIADLVADVRAPTPSAAAQMVTPVKQELEQQIAQRCSLLCRAMAKNLSGCRERFSGLTRNLKDPRWALRQARQRLDEDARDLIDSARRSLMQRRLRVSSLAQRLRPPRVLLRESRLKVNGLTQALRKSLGPVLREERSRAERLDGRLREAINRCVAIYCEQPPALARRAESAFRQILERQRRRMIELGSRLDSLSPLRVLERGYAIAINRQGGRIVVDASHVHVGDVLDVRVHRGRLRARTLAVMPDAARPRKPDADDTG